MENTRKQKEENRMEEAYKSFAQVYDLFMEKLI